MLYVPTRQYPTRKPTGAKLALKPVHVWGIRVRLQVANRVRNLALFDLALDSKLRGCDLVRLKVSDVLSAGGVKRRVVIVQQKTGRPVQFEVTKQARRSVGAWWTQNSWRSTTGFSPVECDPAAILARVNMHVWSTNGSPWSGSIQPLTALTACGERRSHCSTRRRVTCVPANCSSAILSSKARSAI